MRVNPLTNRNRGLSQAFYRHKLYETALGYNNLEDFMVNFWEKWACSKGIVGSNMNGLKDLTQSS
jgi:hypothetical protein